MAEQIPFSIVENLLMELGSAISREVGLMYGVRSELGKLQEKLSMIKAVLLDAEEQQQTSHAVAIWVRRLKDVVYDADDLFDDFSSEELRRRTDVKGRLIAGQVSDFFSSSNHLAFRSKMGHRIKATRERLDDIANDINKFNFIINPRGLSNDVPVRNRGRETCSVVEKSHKIVGRYEDKKQIIELLLMQSSSGSHGENLSIVAIVGIGGLGKTTLAQLVYNDLGVSNYFDLKMWVCVSDDFDVKILVRNVIKSATNKGVEDLELDQLQQGLRRHLDGKRYLLVLDDVWNEDAQKWGQFITLLPVGANGSKVLVTTRSPRVASVMGIDSPYRVEGLKHDESWDLFESLAFKKGEEKMHPNLVALGKEIVKMCKGVPLVIRTLGRLLCCKTHQESHWLSIKNNRSLILLGDNNDILPVLRLSYDNLPIHLKQCFAYCALFPKDYLFQKSDLVQLWMAQGYIQPSHENEYCLEDVGDEYFEDLLTRSLFEEHVENYDNNGVLGYKMHDLIHDLAQSIVNSEVIILTDDIKAVPKRVHHVSFSGATNEVPEDLMDKPIRTFLMLKRSYNYYAYDLENRHIPSLKCLRVMKVHAVLQIPTSLDKLSHLRYLDLSQGHFENLPNAVTRLKHLQTLKLYWCDKLQELPRNMKKLINLRHLAIHGCVLLRYMPHGFGELTQLQTLPFFWVGDENKIDSWERRHKRMHMGGVSELTLLNNLRGDLVIEGLSNARGTREAKEAIMKGKQYIESLTLKWSESAADTRGSEEAVSVMESLQPHPNLKMLSMCDYGGVRFPNWMMNDGLNLLLPNLVCIHMVNCERCQVLPPFGQLPSLEVLNLYRFLAAEYMKDYPLSAKPFFPSLKKLKICIMPNLKRWGMRNVPAEAEQTLSYPCLEELYIGVIPPELCSHMMCVSSSLKSLEISEIMDLMSLPDWIGLLTSLTRIDIIYCPKLASLPEEMRSLRNLEFLRIIGCPYLYERCKKKTGEDWPKISHIRYITISLDHRS